MHGACETGRALSNNHTCIQPCVIVFTHMIAHRSSVAWVEIEMRTLITSAIMTVHQTAVSLLRLSRELIVCFKVKVCNSVTEPPSGVLEGLQWCRNIAALLSVLYYSEALGWCSVYKRNSSQGEQRLPAVRFHLTFASTSTIAAKNNWLIYRLSTIKLSANYFDNCVITIIYFLRK